jgi:transposase
MPRLSNNDRNQALGMLRAGISTREVARLFNCHQSTVVHLRQRLQTTNNVSDRPRPGQPRVTTDQQDRHIRLQHLRKRFKTAASTARETPGRHNPRISSATVRRRLRENGLRTRRPFRGPLLTPRHRQQCLAWVKTHLQWTRQRWQEVLFSDESRFCISNADGRIRVWRRQNERLAACCINEVDR